MKFQINCGRSYSEEAEAKNFTEALAVAFQSKLPLSIGEVIAIRQANPKKKSGWDSAAYMLTRHALDLIDARDLFTPMKRGFVLNTQSSRIEKVEPSESPMPEVATKTTPLHIALNVFRKFALELNKADVREQNFILTLLMRHLQARMGMDKLQPFLGKPPDDANQCLEDFKKLAAELEEFTPTDNTLIVNLLQQAFQWRAANEVGQLMALSKVSVQ